ncbi:HD domain-containing protein [Globicatella sanguinis]|uniref:HD domain-containing protein n=1 Tax=Globicatella sanguinis TaxID=13076 RepID=UPI002542BF7C|nr:HD domain-containing protein [Globicatella sanguinis]MDK7630913.1 HD domain-containing protein [Globicatella sanguinis]WIK67395.1 HD domain-containing protein [Globicatella sanguinis]WKT56800.1 HD domain-containing protein [Globicatella sanguinis]
MDVRKFLEILSVAERLKDTTHHCYTSKGRHESVAEHTWMMSLMAFFLRDEFPDIKVTIRLPNLLHVTFPSYKNN